MAIKDYRIRHQQEIDVILHQAATRFAAELQNTRNCYRDLETEDLVLQIERAMVRGCRISLDFLDVPADPK